MSQQRDARLAPDRKILLDLLSSLTALNGCAGTLDCSFENIAYSVRSTSWRGGAWGPARSTFGVDLAGGRADYGHKSLSDDPIRDFAKCGSDDDGDRQIDDVAA
jgi:hypothetical protein